MKGFEPDAVEDGLLVGRAPGSPEDYALLADLGVTDTITLQTMEEARSIGIRPSVSFRVAAANRIVEHRVGIEDFSHAELASKAKGAASLVRDLRARGRNVYVHCAVGMNRSPTVVAVYLAVSRGIGYVEACDIVEHHHPSQPDVEAVRLAVDEE